MSEAIIVALLSLAGTLFGSFAGIMAANKLVNYRLQELENKVEKHNRVIERVYKLEQHDAVEVEELRAINEKIANLQEFHKPKG
jgi:hypothetical protein